MDEAKRAAAAARKRERNRRDYERSRSSSEHVLLRLDPGGCAALDAAAARSGISRAAFARMFIPAIVGAVGSRYAEIERARAASSRSLAQFLASAIDEAIANDVDGHPESQAAASEFDALFGPEA